MSELRTGGCLCGAVRFSARVEAGLQACHCRQCQQWTGGGPLFVAHVAEMQITQGEDALHSYHASHWGERITCATCGSTLWWKMQGKPTRGVAAGLLDDQAGLTVTEEIFVDYRPDWLPAFEGATQSTEAQEEAKLRAYLEREST
ncbi:GFA family protein [Pseudaestuariivita atlantica]|uniref:CENP-V/GFA domain-containing protein n=1 Tax=Pseudaestuariivita atlantica TaxID=1317121 RepID=A0A0L1JQB0_9RHOB|nr:GFA family protein [Pseudaestuariivita atlantica]KNG93603.1 hypothetical protein ATO11_10350 [Pseudaestuariivita atlantica]